MLQELEEEYKYNQEEHKNEENAAGETQTGDDTGCEAKPEENIESLQPPLSFSNVNVSSAGRKYELLDMLFTFIIEKQKNEEVNPVLSGYFQKVVMALLSFRQKEVMNYIYRKETLMSKLLEHVYDKSI